jgi:hypothetical protein
MPPPPPPLLQPPPPPAAAASARPRLPAARGSGTLHGRPPPAARGPRASFPEQPPPRLFFFNPAGPGRPTPLPRIVGSRARRPACPGPAADRCCSHRRFLFFPPFFFPPLLELRARGGGGGGGGASPGPTRAGGGQPPGSARAVSDGGRVRAGQGLGGALGRCHHLVRLLGTPTRCRLERYALLELRGTWRRGARQAAGAWRL